METASHQPLETSFDKAKNAAINENTPSSTANVLDQNNQAPHPISDATNTTATTSTGTAPAADAPGYLQQAREALVSLAGTAQNAVGIETPASTLHSIADNTKIDASLPTSEHKGATAGERVGGVGSLPGNASEEGVARLPDERTSVPSRELEGSYPGERSGGVGALPGGPNESGVALLPDERSTDLKSNVEHSANKSNVLGSTDRSNVEGTTTRPHVEGAANALAHPRSENPDKTDLKTAAAHPIETAKQRRGSASSSSASSSDEEDATGATGTTDATGTTGKSSRKGKVSLKQKLAGGVKVATGKMKKDEDMIAEGQAMRGH